MTPDPGSPTTAVAVAEFENRPNPVVFQAGSRLVRNHRIFEIGLRLTARHLGARSFGFHKDMAITRATFAHVAMAWSRAATDRLGVESREVQTSP